MNVDDLVGMSGINRRCGKGDSPACDRCIYCCAAVGNILKYSTGSCGNGNGGSGAGAGLRRRGDNCSRITGYSGSDGVCGTGTQAVVHCDRTAIGSR